MSEIEDLARQVLETEIDLPHVQRYYATYLARRRERLLKLMRILEENGERDPEAALQRVFGWTLDPEPDLAPEMARQGELVRRLMAHVGPSARIADLAQLPALAQTPEEEASVRVVAEGVVREVADSMMDFAHSDEEFDKEIEAVREKVMELLKIERPPVGG